MKIEAKKNGRADVVLAEETGFARSFVQKLIAKGGVKIAGNTVKKPSAKVSAGDNVYVSRKLTKCIQAEEFAYKKIGPEPISFGIVYEDEGLLVVDKPVGLVVHPAHACPSGTLLNGVVHYLGLKENSTDSYFPKPINRIDKDTSGLVLIAKTEECYAYMSRQFRERTVEKQYKVVVFGDFATACVSSAFAEKFGVLFDKKKDGQIDFGTWVNRSRVDRRRTVVSAGGRWALSKFYLEKTKEIKSIGERLSLVRVEIFTGRTHQIRAQFKALGFNIVGDPMYSNKRYKKVAESLFSAVNVSPRMLLHSWKIGIKIPGGKKMTFTANIPQNFQDVFSEKKKTKTK